MKIFGWFALALVALLVAVEIAFRLAGVLNFPLFSAGPPYGYIPQPNQRGAFLHKNDWVFNELSMGSARRFETPGAAIDTLLVGDSIVSGGNPYRQADRLGPQLEKHLGGRVWPISANSWAMANELTYIRVNPEVARHTDRFVFITNSEDFGAPSIWRSPVTHPTKRPLSAIVYVVQKKLVRPQAALKTPYSPREAWQAFRSAHTQPVIVAAYPNRAEAADAKLRASQLLTPLRELVGPNTQVIDVGADPRWAKVRYRDNIHPAPEGTALLATIISDATKLPHPPR